MPLQILNVLIALMWPVLCVETECTFPFTWATGSVWMHLSAACNPETSQWRPTSRTKPSDRWCSPKEPLSTLTSSPVTISSSQSQMSGQTTLWSISTWTHQPTQLWQSLQETVGKMLLRLFRITWQCRLGHLFVFQRLQEPSLFFK